MAENKAVTRAGLMRAGFRRVSASTYVKYEPLTTVRTTVTFDNANKTMHVRHDQDVEAVIELNKIRQNQWKGRFGDDVMTQVTSIPWIEHRKIMAMCGKDAKGQYDEKRFKRIINDPDYRYFKTITGKL